MHPLELIRRCSGHQMPRLGLWANHVYQAVRPRRIRCEIVRGVSVDLDLDDDTANNIFYLGARYERPTLAMLDSWVPDGPACFFDIGANFGFFSLALIQRHPRLRALTLEPHPETFRRLEAIAHSNQLSRLDCVQVAASNRRAELPFNCDPKNSGASHIQTGSESGGKHILVTAMPFDEVVAGRGIENMDTLAKIDVEGHEMAVLEGMAKTLSTGRMAGLCIEMNAENLARAGSSPDAIRAFLARHGYQPVFNSEIERAHRARTTDNWFFERTSKTS